MGVEVRRGGGVMNGSGSEGVGTMWEWGGVEEL